MQNLLLDGLPEDVFGKDVFLQNAPLRMEWKWKKNNIPITYAMHLLLLHVVFSQISCCKFVKLLYEHIVNCLWNISKQCQLVFEPFHPTCLFLLTLKTSEKQRLSDVFWGVQKETSSVKWVKIMNSCLNDARASHLKHSRVHCNMWSLQKQSFGGVL